MSFDLTPEEQRIIHAWRRETDARKKVIASTHHSFLWWLKETNYDIWLSVAGWAFERVKGFIKNLLGF